MKKVMLLVLISWCASMHSQLTAAELALIPQPQSLETSGGFLKFPQARIFNGAGLRNELSFLKQFLDENKMRGQFVEHEQEANFVLKMGEVKNPVGLPGAYKLSVNNRGVEIVAAEPAGFFYAIQTLRQLAHGPKIPKVEIQDWAAFKVRGFMHDIGRNFLPMSILKEQAEMMALYKMNTFHLHLTDYPGYRLESTKYPILNAKETGEKDRQPGQFYTKKEMKEFIAFCKARHILIIPEIDMPGHSAYFNRAFGTDMQSEKGVPILKEIIKEVVEIFPAEDVPYMHIGSDEVRIYNKTFMKDMSNLIRSFGHEVIYWRPGGGVIDDKVITHLWTGGAKPIGNNPYIDSRATYVNHMDPLGGVPRLFFMQPCWQEDGKDPRAMGGILCSWADNTIDEAKGPYGIFDITPIYAPMIAWSQNLWKGRKNDELPTFVAKLPERNSPFFKEFVDFERKLLIHRDRFFKNKHFQYVKQTDIPWQLIGPFKNEALNKAVEQSAEDSYSANGQTVKWLDTEVTGGTIHLQHFFGFQAYLDKQPKDTVYAQTWVYSPKKQKTQWWIQFGTPSSSGRRNAANPKLGEWNHYGANIWVNGKRTAPPVWNNPGGLGSQKASYKVPFTMEGYFYREPTEILLNKGWNRVLVQVPGSTHRKSKWMFTCVPIKTDGRNVREAGLKFALKPE